MAFSGTVQSSGSLGQSTRPRLPLPVVDGGRPLYKLAATILTSRCFPGRTFHARISSSSDANAEAQNRAVKKWSAADPSTCPVLLPVFDLANHDPEAKVSWTFGPEHCSLAVEEVIGEGEQIYNNYGPKSNEECKLLCSNGIENGVAAYNLSQ